MQVLHVPARTHGRVAVRPGRASPPRLLLAFHGYAQRAESMLEMLEGVPGIDAWTVASVQALHPFYGRQEQTVASWMTRDDRDLAIAENVAYVDDVVRTVERDGRMDRVVCFGFSQGASMAWRAAVLGARRVDAVAALAGDIPPELASEPAARFPRAFIAAGTRDEWYSEAKMNADVTLLEQKGATVETLRFEGGHEATESFRAALARYLTKLVNR